MLRGYRTGDAGPLARLATEQFPEEQALLGIDPKGVEELAVRLHRWNYRLVLGFLSAIGRPIFRLIIIEEGGEVAGTAVLTYGPRAGYASTVAVDPKHRRRGHARRIIAECVRRSAKRGRRYLALEVLASNAPARALYDSMGFRLLRETAFFVREPVNPPPFTPRIPGVREIQRSDGAALARVASRELPEDYLRVLPPTKGDFLLSPIVVSGLNSETEAWVVDTGSGPTGFLRATKSATVQAGHLTAPLLPDSVPDPLADSMIEGALSWFSGREVPRIVCQLALSATRSRAKLESLGFKEAFRSFTLFRPTGP